MLARAPWVQDLFQYGGPFLVGHTDQAMGCRTVTCGA